MRSSGSAAPVVTASTRWPWPSPRRSTRASTCSSRRARAPASRSATWCPRCGTRCCEDERVVVSTATLALQRQVITRDLPLVAKAVAPQLPRAPAHRAAQGLAQLRVRAQGRRRVPRRTTRARCSTSRRHAGRAREHAGAAEHPAPAAAPGRPAADDLGDQVLRLREWAEETDTGDRDDLVPGRHATGRGGRCPSRRWSAWAASARCSPSASRRRRRQPRGRPTSSSPTTRCSASPPPGSPGRAARARGARRRRGARAHRPGDGAGDRPTCPSRPSSTRPGSPAGTAASRRPTSTRRRQALATVLVGLPEGRFRDGLPPGRPRRRRERARRRPRAAQRAQAGRTGAATAAAEGGLKMAQAAMLALFEMADRMAADPEDDRHTRPVVLAAARTAPAARVARHARLHAAPLAVNGPHPHPPARRAVGGPHLGDARAGRHVRPARPGARAGGPPRRRTRRPDLAGGEAPAAPAGVPWRGLDVGSPFDYRARGSSTSRGTCRRPGREPTTDAQLDEIADARSRPRGGRTLGPVLVAAGGRRPRPRPCASGSTCRSSRRATTSCRPSSGSSPRTRPPACSARCRSGRASTSRGRRASSSSSTASPSRGRTTRSGPPARTPSSRRAATGSCRSPRTHAALLLAQGAGRLIRSTSRPRRRRGAGPPAGDGAVRRVPHPVAAGVLAHHGPGRVVAALERLSA